MKDGRKITGFAIAPKRAPVCENGSEGKRVLGMPHPGGGRAGKEGAWREKTWGETDGHLE